MADRTITLTAEELELCVEALRSDGEIGAMLEPGALADEGEAMLALAAKLETPVRKESDRG